jgi:hypothetical protein
MNRRSVLLLSGVAVMALLVTVLLIVVVGGGSPDEAADVSMPAVESPGGVAGVGDAGLTGPVAGSEPSPAASAEPARRMAARQVLERRVVHRPPT